MKLNKIILVCLITLVATACSKGKYREMSKAELTKKQLHCDSIPKKSAVFANGCDKVLKEIKRRKSLN